MRTDCIDCIVLRVCGGGVRDVYTRRLVTVNYSLFTHFKDLCLNFYVYLYMRSFYIHFYYLYYVSNFSLLCHTDASDVCE